MENVNVEENSLDVVINIELLDAIKNFVNDLSNISSIQNFVNYSTIVNRIDETKIKSYIKLINGFKVFFVNNREVLSEGAFENLVDPNISYVTENVSFSFNFQNIYMEANEENQDAIKDHLNYIFNMLENNKSKEEIYIDKLKNLVIDFQKQNLNMTVVIKKACQKARNMLLLSNDSDNSKTLALIDAVEEIDLDNFSIMNFVTLVTKISTLFLGNGENNPLATMFSTMSQLQN